jgi:hypothetical protein
MVAESSTQKTSKGQESLLEAAKPLLVKITVNDQATPENFPEWITGLENWVTTTDVLSWVLVADGNVQVPFDQMEKVQAQHSAQQTLKGMVVKVEGDEGTVEEKQKKSASDTDLFLAAAKFAAEVRAKGAKKTGEKMAVYFVDTGFIFTGDQAAKLAGRHVLAEVRLSEEGLGGKSWWCPVESQAKRDNRFFVWRIVGTTLANLDKKLWEHIPLGNVFLLVQFIKNMFGKERVEQQSNKWHSNLEDLRVDKRKGFDIFIAEVNKILGDAKTLGINYDQTNVRNKVHQAIVKGGGTLNDQWVRAVVAEAQELRIKPDAPKWSIPQLLDEMRPGVLAIQSSERALAAMGGTVADSSHNLRKENEELKKQIKKFQSSNKREERPSWLGVCGAFQEGACKRANCAFKHTVLSLEDKLKLQEHLKKKAEERAQGTGGRTFSGKCFKCGKDGHRSDKCPSKGTASIKKTLAELFKRDDFEQLLQQAKCEAKDQPEDEE